MAHFNVQIHIQRVDESRPERLNTTCRCTSGSRCAHNPPTERQVTEVLKLAVTADTEALAYVKAHRILTANEPLGE